MGRRRTPAERRRAAEYAAEHGAAAAAAREGCDTESIRRWCRAAGVEWRRSRQGPVKILQDSPCIP